jgi:hypothetical protein
MQARHLIRPLLVSVALTLAGPAMAQTTDKDRATTSKPGATKSSTAKQAPAAKRLDFAPSGSVKETSTRPAAPAQTPAKDGWHCDHEVASDA